MMFYKETNFKETPVGEIPKEWQVVRLGDITEIDKESKDRARETPNETFTYIDIDSIEQGTGKIRHPKRILGRNAPSRARRVIYENDVIMSTVRPYLKAFAMVTKEYDKQICSTGFGVLSCRASILPYFLLSVLFSEAVISQCNRMMMGGQYPALNQSQVSQINIALPPLLEQQKIAEVLSTVDEAIQKTSKVIAKTERLKKGLMQKLLTKGIGPKEFKDTEVGKIPKEWEVVTVRDLGEVITGTTPSTSVNDYWNGKYPFVTPTDFSGDRYVYATERTVTEKGLKKARAIPKDSVLVVCIGSTIGKVSLAFEGCITNQQINAILCKEGINPHYVYYTMALRKDLLRVQAGITAKPIVKKSMFEKFHLPLPSLPEQQKIAETLSTVDTKLELERNEKARLERIKQGMMDLLLTGKVRVKV